jgi:hypothetical protein
MTRETLHSGKIERSYLEETIANTDGLMEEGILVRDNI